MTKAEFYLRSIIAMCSNPAYVDNSECEPINDNDTEKVISHRLDVTEIIMDAEDLLKETEQAWDEAFVDTNAVQEKIKETLDGINENLDYIVRGIEALGE